MGVVADIDGRFDDMEPEPDFFFEAQVPEILHAKNPRDLFDGLRQFGDVPRRPGVHVSGDAAVTVCSSLIDIPRDYIPMGSSK